MQPEMAWLLPFLGDWHILKNYSLALMKIYGPAGLHHELLALLHKGRTERAILNCSDFDKMFAFIFQTWEAMYRKKVEMFLKYKEMDSEDEMPSFDQKVFLTEVSNTMSVYLNMDKSWQEYADAFSILQAKLAGEYDKFINFLSDMSAQNDTFNFWCRYIHNDCMAYILLYLSNWHLWMSALKKMMPVFQLSIPLTITVLSPTWVFRIFLHLRMFCRIV